MVALLTLLGAVVIFVVGYLVGTARSPRAEPFRPDVVPPTDSMQADVLDRLPIGAVIAAPSGAIDYRNPAASALSGTHVGVLIDELVAKHLEAALSDGRSGETIELYGPPQRVVVVNAEAIPAVGAVAFVEDVTDRRRADQARTDFVANVSHELRTPIGALIALADSLVGTEDPAITERVVGRMQQEADRASRIVEDLLELSEIEAGIERERRIVSLRDVVHDAIGRVAELAARVEIEIVEPAIDGVDARGVELTVNGDRSRLVSAVGNVVENAVKYSEPGGVVRVCVRASDAWGEVVVADEGVGIPRRDLDRVFERFYRVDRARSRSTGGTGLGLSIVRHVAHAHGGSVSVESVEGQGSTFVLRLPLAVGAEMARADAIGSPPETEGTA